MIIEIEIGTAEQKKKIDQEIRSLFTKALNKPEIVNRIIVPKDLELSVRQHGEIYFTAKRTDVNQCVMAKILEFDNGNVVFLSADFYTDRFYNDYNMRYIFFLHEIIHLNNNRPKQDISNISGSLRSDINRLYDEFLAHFGSWQTVLGLIPNSTPSVDKELELNKYHQIMFSLVLFCSSIGPGNHRK